MIESKPLILGAQLRKARELLKLSVEEAAAEVQATEQEMQAWEEGQSKPSLAKLETLAKIYGREIDYFLKETPDPPTDIRFRGKPGKALRSLSSNARNVLARFEELCRTEAELEDLLQKRREIRLRVFEPGQHPRSAARQLREQFSLGEKPVPGLRNLLQDAGARVFEMPVPGDEISGFSFWHGDYGPCILVNAGDVKGRKNFTLAHELAHLLLGHGSSVCYIPPQVSRPEGGTEHTANQFAVEVLLPATGVNRDFTERNLSNTPSQKELALMANKWGVSVQALGYRLETLQLVVAGLTDSITEPKPYFRGSKTPIWKKRLGKHFVDTSFEAYKKQLISLSKLAHALQIPIRKAMELVESEAQ